MYSKTNVKANRVVNDIDFHSFTCVRCLTELFELSVGIPLEFPVTLLWASMRENLFSGVCEQHRCRSACAFAQTDQRLCYLLF